MGAANPLRLSAAIMLIVLLAGVLIWQLFDWSSEETPGVEEATIDTPAPIIVTDEDVWIEATREALDGWAQFAASGDLGALDGLFDPEGPQYAQLVGEASTLIATESAYGFVFDDPTTELHDGFPVVSGQVTLTLYGEPIDEVMWDIYLVEKAGRWLIWAVEER